MVNNQINKHCKSLIKKNLMIKDEIKLILNQLNKFYPENL